MTDEAAKGSRFTVPRDKPGVLYTAAGVHADAIPFTSAADEMPLRDDVAGVLLSDGSLLVTTRWCVVKYPEADEHPEIDRPGLAWSRPGDPMVGVQLEGNRILWCADWRVCGAGVVQHP